MCSQSPLIIFICNRKHPSNNKPSDPGDDRSQLELNERRDMKGRRGMFSARNKKWRMIRAFSDGKRSRWRGNGRKSEKCKKRERDRDVVMHVCRTLINCIVSMRWERKRANDAAFWLDIPLACMHVTRLFRRTSSCHFAGIVISSRYK